VTRDPAGNPGADDARGPHGTSGRRRPPAGTGPFWPVAPPGPAAAERLEDTEGIPGYEFEGRRSQRGHQAWWRQADHRGSGYQVPRGPAWTGHPAEPRDPDGESRRLRYPPATSLPRAAWPEDEPATPGFEFDGRAPAAGPAGPLPSGARSGWKPAGSARPRPDLGAARAEWGHLLRSFLPQSAKRNWFRRFLSALDFRGLTLRVAISILAMIVIGVFLVLIAGAGSSRSGPVPDSTALGFPPASLAGREFTAADSGRGISQTLGRVTSDGTEIVAVGSQAGARIARAQFFVSLDDGHSWAMGSVRTPSGGPPPPGHAARLVAGGHGAWVALGPGSVWTSTDGQAWTLSSVTGLPLLPGDQIDVLKRTAGGFIAAGANVPGGVQAKASPVVFLSANGIIWRRLDAGQLRLAAGAGRALDIRYAAAYQNRILIAGDAAEPAGRPGRAKTVQTSAAWLSTDGGTTWVPAVRPAVTPAGTPAVTPAGHGARAEISGAAATADGFILVRQATAGARPAVDVYRSPNGTAWTFEATLGAGAGFTAGMVNGGPDGAVVAGQAGRVLTAFVSADGASWRQTPAFASSAAESVSGVDTATGLIVVAAGTSGDDPDSRQPLITVLGAPGLADHVDVAAIPGAADRQLAVTDVAAENGRLVAVGSANGYPAAWTSADGGSSWTRAVGQTPAVLERPGIQQLTSVTYGTAGWLAVGGVTAVAAQHPVVVGSANGRSWQAADGESAFAGPGLFTEQAAAGPAGYVIVGYQVVSDRTIAAAWWSAGLTGWHRAAGVPNASAQMLAVTASPRGFVVVGVAGHQPSAWTSTDGQDWTQVSLPLPIGATSAVLQHVASNGRALAAVGTALTTAGQQVPFAATSSDGGATWIESVLPVPAGQASVTALAAAGRGYIATGTFGRTPGHQDVVVWTSASGSAWTPVTPAGPGLTGPGIQAITGLAASGGTLTGVGFTASPSGEQPVFWQTPVR
jgi:hypothetical protein